MVLLDLLARDKNLDLVVAHFDHGIRTNSYKDAEFVCQRAKELDLPFFCERVELGEGASEAEARKFRYSFLKKVRDKVGAKAIITAHHQDDVIETALLNILRGTKRRGLISLKSTSDIIRPLLKVRKQQLYDYAVKNELEWHEDPTNEEVKYRRNQIRFRLARTLSEEKRTAVLGLLDRIEVLDDNIGYIVESYLKEHKQALPRKDLIELPEEIGSEIIAAWLRKNDATFDSKAIQRIIQGARALQTGSQIDVQQNRYCLVTKSQIVLKQR